MIERNHANFYKFFGKVVNTLFRHVSLTKTKSLVTNLLTSIIIKIVFDIYFYRS